MRRTLGLSSPVYDIPMDDNELIVIGRIAVVWGQIIFHLDSILLELMGNRTVETMRSYPLTGVSTKLGHLHRELSKPENTHQRTHLRNLHTAIDGLVSDRNVIFHGLWGYWLDQEDRRWVAASKSYSRDEAFSIEDLRDFHERLIAASVTVSDVWWLLMVNEGEPPQNRNRRQFWSDHEPSADDPPQPLASPR